MTFRLVGGDAIQAMQAMAENSVDTIVTDPPYGLEFMGKEWDRLGNDNVVGHGGRSVFASPKPRFTDDVHAAQVWHHAWATEALRILKPGGHLLAFGGTRTYHRLACAIEDAGFEIRDCLAWMYGSGFPKSLDVSKAIDKAAGAEREVVGAGRWAGREAEPSSTEDWRLRHEEPRIATAPATPEAQRWNGWGTALKPAFEPIVLARKPLAERNVAANVQRWGTGALNIDGCRIEGEPHAGGEHAVTIYGTDANYEPGPNVPGNPAGRWPANVTLGHSPDCEQTDEVRKVKTGTAVRHRGVVPGLYSPAHPEGTPDATYADPDGTESVQVWNCAPGCAVAMLDEQTGETTSRIGQPRTGANGNGWGMTATGAEYADTGGASRFFYCPKADREERNRGVYTEAAQVFGPGTLPGSLSKPMQNTHPTVKPVELMRWLCRMVTPKGGTVLDPFTGSGSTGVAAMREGFEFIGIEREAEYVEIARARIIGDAPLFNLEAEPQEWNAPLIDRIAEVARERGVPTE